MVAKSQISIEAIYLLQFGVREAEIKNVHVFGLVLEAAGFWDDCMTSAQTPVEHYLNDCFLVSLGYLHHQRVVSQVWPVLWAEAVSLLVASWPPDRSEGHGPNILRE